MTDLPKSFVVFLAVAAVVITLVVILGLRQFLFWRFKKQAEGALAEGNFCRALHLFRRAERIWDFNITKQTPDSDVKDVAALDEVLHGIERACQALGIHVSTDEYRDAIEQLRSGIGNLRKKHSSAAKSYASAFMRLKQARSFLRKQLQKQVSRVEIGSNAP